MEKTAINFHETSYFYNKIDFFYKKRSNKTSKYLHG